VRLRDGQACLRWLGRRPFWVVLALTVASGFLFSLNLGANDLGPADEGYCGVMALNASSGIRELINPSLSPMGPPGDRPLLHALVLAAAVHLGGIDEVSLRLVSVILGVLVAPLLFFIGDALGSRIAGMWAAVLWLTSPMLAGAARAVDADLLVVVLGLGGVWLFVHSLQVRRWPYALAAGVLFGLAFLSKLWLALIPAVAVVGGAWLANAASPRPERVRWRTWWGLALTCLCGFVVAGSMQLVVCGLVTPEHLGHWVSVYFGQYLSGRMEGADIVHSHKPVLFYVAQLARTGCLCVPMAGLGAAALIGRRGGDGRRWLAAGLLLVWPLALVPMSVPSIKDISYLLPVLPGVFLLAGFGIEALVGHLGRKPLPRWQLVAGLLLAAAGAVASQLILARGRRLPNLACAAALVVQSAWIAGLLLAGSRRRGLILARLAVVGCLIGAIAGGVVQQVQTTSATNHVTGYARIARLLEPGLRGLDPGQLCFIAPECPSMSFYTFRSGRYWESAYVEPDPGLTLTALRGSDPFFFVVPTGAMRLYGGRPGPEVLRAIAAEAHRLDLDLGPRAPVRVYVNDALHAALAGVGPEV